MKYLHEPTPGTLVLDHRLTPEVRAMLAAMVSRSPVGGMKQRYVEVVEAVAAELWPGSMPLPYMRDYGWAEAKTVTGDLGLVAQAQYVDSASTRCTRRSRRSSTSSSASTDTRA